MNKSMGVLAATIALGALVAAALVFAPGSARADERAGDGAWRTASLWDDGMAEYSAYEVEWRRYGRTYTGRALLVAVKEPWAPDLEVKADRDRPDGFDVIKLNHMRDVATGIYTYHQMASTFVRRDSGDLRKLAAMSAEACGLSTADVVGGRLTTRSYFDGQGTRAQPYPRGALPEDSLPLVLREFVHGDVPKTLEVFPTLMAGRFPELEPTTYRVTRRDAPAVETPAGSFAGVELVLESEGGSLSYTFGAASPHRLLLHGRSDGTTYRLAKSERIPYWNMHDPGDERWLPETVR